MAAIEIFKNESFGEVRVAGTSEKPLFCLVDVCKVLELGNPSQVKTRLEDGVISNEVIPDSLGRQQEMTFINEDGLYDVILDSRKPQAKAFRKWITSVVLPSIRNTGKYEIKSEYPKKLELRDVMDWINFTKEILHLNDNSVLSLMRQVAEPLRLPLPDYVDSKGVLKSASELIKQFNVGIKIQAFNALMVAKGLLEVKTRKSHKGEKKFKALTEPGLSWGENQVTPANPNEVQPRYYEAKFKDLLGVIGVEV